MRKLLFVWVGYTNSRCNCFYNVSSLYMRRVTYERCTKSLDNVGGIVRQIQQYKKM